MHASRSRARQPLLTGVPSLCAILAFSTLTACAVNPATGRRELSLVGEAREVEIGRRADAHLLGSLRLYGDSAVARYVSDLGRQMARASERPDLPWTFRVLDDPAVNAFALPGGFIYVTRGILAHLGSEAELAGVLGHEIGHVTARHSVGRISRSQLQQIGLAVGTAVSDDVARFGDLVSSGLGLMNLRHSRGDERQSDELGVRYMDRAGYDARALIDVFRTLALASGGRGSRLPEWQSTHHYPEQREERIRGLIAERGGASGALGRERFLQRLDGLVYGEDPRDGYFEGERFLHPDLAFELHFPRGWRVRNQPAAVSGTSPQEDAAVVLTLPDQLPDPVAAARAFGGLQGITAGPIRQTVVHGIPAASADFRGGAQGGELWGSALFGAHAGRLFRILGYGTADGWARSGDAVRRALRSFAPVRDPRVLGARPRRVHVVRVPRTMTFPEFHDAFPSVVGLEETARLNRVDAREELAEGRLMKRVVRER